ncbi:expansin EXLX1 family cellulose-binding protein [Streptomyces sp. NPDC058867]|uniref:expansin EXLX1 family cellulose-binding protein n=1 Tax=unclassified Streptomyces TaxID=2593676 RepID=UPI0036A4C364
MKTPRQAARQRRRRQRLTAVTAAALTAVAGVLLYLVVAPSDGTDDAPSAASDSVAATRTDAPTPTTPAPSPTPSTSASASRTPTAKARESGGATARPSATKAPKAAAPVAVPAGRIRPGTTYEGVATHYDAGDGDGACMLGPSDDMMIAAMNTADYETSRACGAYVLVRAESGASVTVRVTNECPAPCEPGQLDLSKQAFAKLADLDAGLIGITWTLLSPATDDTVSIRYKTGSSAYWCGIQAVDHRNPIARLEVEADGGWRQLPRAEYNYFLAEDGRGCGGALRITDIHGERLTVRALPVRPDVLQPTGVQFARH